MFFSSYAVFAQTVVVYGDSQGDYKTHRKIVEAIIRLEPKAVFHTGDLVQDGLSPPLWKKFNEITADLREKSSFYPALGNHEYNSIYYFDNFDLPNNERWYSVIVAGVKFIVLDSNFDLKPGSVQYDWLENQLQDIDDNIRFVSVVFHHPPFTTGKYNEYCEYLQKNLVPLIEQYGVDIVFNGDSHSYERLFHNGTYYVITAGGGAALYYQTRTSPYSQVFIKTHNFCVLDIDGEQISVKALDLNSNVIDEFIIKSQKRWQKQFDF